MSPAISVIFPARNAAAYIGQAIDSVLTQTFKDFELILIDDGSTDGTNQIIEDAAKKDTRVVPIAGASQGLVAALNAGLRVAKAHIIARMDADDISYPERFARQFDYLALHPDVIAVGAQVVYVGADGAIQGSSSFPTDPGTIHKHLRRRGCCISHPTVMMRSAAVRGSGGYRSCMRDAEDYDLWLRLTQHNLVANLGEHLLSYRIHEKQTSSDNNLRQRFSYDFALLCDELRLSGAEDPSYMLAESPLLEAPYLILNNDVRRLVMAYAAFADLKTASLADVKALYELTSTRLMGGSRRLTAETLVAVAKRAVQLGAVTLALRAISHAVRISPGRFAGLWLHGHNKSGPENLDRSWLS